MVLKCAMKTKISLCWFAVAVAAVLFVAPPPCHAAGVWQGTSTPCTDPNEYFYEYESNEEYFNDDDGIGKEQTMTPQTSQMKFTFGIRCIEIGNFDGTEATLYDLADVTTSELSGTVITNLGYDGYDIDEAMTNLDISLLQNSFQFVKLSSGDNAGSIPATFYNKSEEEEIVNVKKTLASNFQARYQIPSRGTFAAIETDPQSLHRSMYDVSGGGNSSKSSVDVYNITDGGEITRTISDEDVYEFSSSIPGELIDYNRKDIITLREGQIVRSSGFTDIRLVPPEPVSSMQGETYPDDPPVQDTMRAKLYKRQTEEGDDEPTYDATVITNYYNVKSNSDLKITGSRRVKRSVRSSDQIDLSDSIQSTLFTYINQTKKALKVMTDLRKQLGDITDALVKLRQHPKKLKLASNIESLVKMEAKYGTTPGYTPAVDDVIDYLYSVRLQGIYHIVGFTTTEDVNTRNLLYFILSPEGSIQAQMAIMSGLENAVDEEEKENVLFYLAFMKNPQPEVVAKMEELITEEKDNDLRMIRLAYSTMVPRASPELQQRMTSFLLENLKMDDLQKNSLVNHILALGNTESQATKDPLLKYLSHPEQAVQLTAIFALRSLLNDPSVQKSLRDIVLNPNSPISHIAMVARSLMHGAEEARFKREHRPYEPDLVYPLIARAANINDEGIHSAVSRYLRAVNSEDSLKLLHHFNSIKTNRYEATNATRLRRGTTWEEDNPVYDLVEPLYERQQDVNQFNNNYAYIWGKKFGGGDINVQIAAGGFTGISDEGEYKVYGHAVAQAYVYGFSKNFIEFTSFRIKTVADGTHTKLFASIMGKTLKDYDLEQDVETCKTFSFSLYEGKVYTIFDFTYGVFVYIGFLNFGVKATAQFNIGMEVSFCEGVGELTVAASLTPSITFVVSGTGDLEVVLIAKAGITVDVSITYALQPGVNMATCKDMDPTIKNCVRVYHQWKDSHIDLYAWYAWRGRCGWWLCHGSDAYKDKKKIDDLTFSWELPEIPTRTLLEHCTADWVC